jgi:hypothetical protein
MDLIAEYGKYTLLKNEKGIYLFCKCGCWVSCGYCKNDTEAINHFAHIFNVPIENIKAF